ncbi:hypothetical protein BGZ97_012285 [Linnemannia gamsii]|uniref:VWFA domain-containing protein n=1 Tax=Linnemannia gamsii TaxID=64522 RepID=A0A9P6RN73_9FUNG|nr:hypothetical protein BGZ97_012285 [Linnemannia gamsii]
MFRFNKSSSANMPPPAGSQPLRGLNRANDHTFQALKATYLAEFDFKGVQVTATPLFSSVLRGLQTQLPVLFEIKVGQRSNEDTDMSRTPFNICLVLDNSGSMNGGRLEGCKKAINAIIQQLTPNDTLSLVTYSSTTRTVFVDCNHTHKKHMLDAVAKIETEGATNLHEGLRVGVDSLKKSIQKESSVQQQGQEKSKKPQEKAHRVFLFSDGLVNVGITSPEAIMSHVKTWLTGTDISISTFGIGDGYDEKLMSAIAEQANGDHLFIETESDIEDLVSKGLRGVSNMVAAAATLKIRGLGDAVIKDIPGYDLTTTPGQITIRNLRVNGLIQFVVNLDMRVPGLDDFSENDMEDVEDQRKILGYALTLEGELNFVDPAECKGMSGTVSVNYTTDSSLVSDDKKNNDVVSYLTIQEASKIDEQVMDHLANNRTTEALKAKKKVISMYSAIAPIDRRGFAQMMQQQSERLVQNLESDGNTRFAQISAQQQQQQSARSDRGWSIYE